MREGWEYKDIGEIANVTDYVANGSFATLRENVHYLDTAGYAILVRLADYTNNFDSSRFVYIDEHAYHFLSKSKLYGGEIIMSNVGSIGKSFICPKLSMPMSLAPNSILINTSNNKFYYYFFGSPFFQSSLKTISSQTALPKFNKTQFKKLIAPIPPLAEQEKIVGELDLLSSVIEKKKAQLEEYDQLAQSIFYDMFGDPVTNEKGWEEEQMGHICTITSSKRIFANEYCEEGIPFYRGKEITELSKGLPISIELKISQERYEEIKSEYGIPSIGDILITAVGTIGNIWVVNDESPFYFKDGNIIWLKDIEGFNSIFFKKLLSLQIEAYKYEMAQGCAYNALTIVNLKKMKALCPPLSLQQEFANKIEAIEKQKELIKQSIAETETLFNSRMDYYFN